MLISFRAGKFGPVGAAQTLSAVARPERVHPLHLISTASAFKLTRAQVLAGRNGAGKSYLLSALERFRSLVLQSTSFTESEYSALHEPFLSRSTLEKPTTFKMELLLEETRFDYEVAYDRNRILVEKLLAYRTGKAQRWFGRQWHEGREEWSAFSSHLHGPREVWRQATRPQALFLTTAAQLNGAALLPLTHWFEQKLLIVRSLQDAFEGVAAYLDIAEFKSRILAEMQTFEPGVLDIRLVKKERGTSHPWLLPQFCYGHAGLGRAWLETDRESPGRQRLCILLVLILRAIEQTQCLCIDDFDADLHPSTARRLLNLICERTESPGPQLLVTSRTGALLEPRAIRRDEMNLMELGEDAASRFRNLADDAALRDSRAPGVDFADG